MKAFHCSKTLLWNPAWSSHTKLHTKLKQKHRDSRPPHTPVAERGRIKKGRHQKAIYRLRLRQKTLHQKNIFRFSNSSVTLIGQLAIVTLFGVILGGIPLSGPYPFCFIRHPEQFLRPQDSGPYHLEGIWFTERLARRGLIDSQYKSACPWCNENVGENPAHIFIDGIGKTYLVNSRDKSSWGGGEQWRRSPAWNGCGQAQWVHQGCRICRLGDGNTYSRHPSSEKP